MGEGGRGSTSSEISAMGRGGEARRSSPAPAPTARKPASLRYHPGIVGPSPPTSATLGPPRPVRALSKFQPCSSTIGYHQAGRIDAGARCPLEPCGRERVHSPHGGGAGLEYVVDESEAGRWPGVKGGEAGRDSVRWPAVLVYTCAVEEGASGQSDDALNLSSTMRQALP